MKKIFFIIFLSLVLCPLIFLITGCGGEQSNNAGSKPKDLKKIVVGVDEHFAPMSFRDKKGNIVGFDIDLAEEAAKRLGVEVEFRAIIWDNKKAEITSGNVDIIWSGCDIIDEYKKYMIFSKPYMDNRQILLVRKGNDKNIHAIGDLADKIVGTQAGSNSEIYVNENEELNASFAAFKTYGNIKDGFNLLSKGELDVIIIDEIAGRYEMTEHPDKFEVVEVTIGSFTTFGIGFRKNDTELRDIIQKVFDSMLKDGTANKISEKWFQADLLKSRK